MDNYRTEEEQVEAIKQWWKKNGTHTLLTVALALAVVFGWQNWQQRQANTAEAASVSYQQLLEVASLLEREPTDGRRATASHLVETLKDEFSRTVYAQYAALLQARLLVENDDLDGAAAQLRWVLDAKPEASIRQLARLRLARVQFAQGDAKGALAIIDEGDFGRFAGAFYELEGDIRLAAGEIEAARGSYQRAQAGSGGELAPNPLVEMKLQSLPAAELAEAGREAETEG